LAVLHSGVDLIEVNRLEKAIARHGDKFLDRIFTEQEREQLKDNLPSLAARWAAKEAVAKALNPSSISMVKPSVFQTNAAFKCGRSASATPKVMRWPWSSPLNKAFSLI
jgi:phosphopantetheine--protein transferase-like protein